MKRFALSMIESFGAFFGIWLATEGYWLPGYLIVSALILLAWTEGYLNWGGRH